MDSLTLRRESQTCTTVTMRTDFAVFIMVWGRPGQMWTAKTLRNQGYTGKIFYVGDDLDPSIEDYRKKYGDDLLVFSKTEVMGRYDSGDNSGDLRSTMYAVNVIPELAKERGIKYFFIFCDDYTRFVYKFDSELVYTDKKILNLDGVFEAMLDYYLKTNALSIAMSQTGDFIGGKNSGMAKELRLKRKAMNSFLCSTDRPFEFVGRMNEDVSTYVHLGHRGGLFFTLPNVCLQQRPTQAEGGGLTEMYLDYGTYVKSFFSVMYNPSSVKVSEMGQVYKRIHHKVNWNNAVPKILSEDWRQIGQ